jgi:K+-transporting ATPase KdpF subunit
VREALDVENALVSTVAVMLIGYLFWTLVRPEDF